LGQAYSPKPSLSPPVSSAGTTPPPSSLAAGTIAFKEDFSHLAEGLAPVGWLGSEKLMVKSYQGRKCLTPFEPGNYRFTIPNMSLPENFRLEWYCSYGTDEQYQATSFQMQCGNVSAGFTENSLRGSSLWVNSASEQTRGRIGGQTLQFTLEKQGPLFRLFVDGAPRVLLRFADFSSSDSLIFDFGNRPFRLYSIRIVAL
jgi:hypothetical protein